MNLEKILMSLLARELLERKVDDIKIRDTLLSDPKLIEILYELSRMHDMAHIICLALKNIGVWGSEEVFAKFQRRQTLSVYRCEQLEYELKRVSEALEKAEILYMPLKGACIRPLYPQGWMRTSSDVDILVKEEDKRKAEQEIATQCGYILKNRSKTQTTFHSENAMCIELHHRNKEQTVEEIPEYVWEKSRRVEGAFRYEMSGEMLYYHVVSHMIKHLKGGGCGIKPFLDMCLLEKKLTLDFAEIRNMLEKEKLLTAYEKLKLMSEVWFGNADGNKLTDAIRKHVIIGGAYGNTITYTNMRHRNKGGKIQYILSLFLPDRKEMERRYPKLKEHRFMLPVYHIRRWGHLIFKGRIRSSVEIVNKNMAVPRSNVDELNYMLKEMGLD